MRSVIVIRNDYQAMSKEDEMNPQNTQWVRDIPILLRRISELESERNHLYDCIKALMERK